MPPIFRLLRPKQWTKNLLVFAAYLFTAGWNSSEATVQVLIAFAALCALSSASYAWNDVTDAAADRNHPRKRLRPIASGAVSPSAGRIVAIASMLVGVGLALTLNPTAQVACAVFVVIQVAYNFGLKRVALVDLMAVSMAFVMRAGVGAAAISAPVSGWLLFCTGSLALMLISAKRRSEFISLGPETSTRSTLNGYNRTLLDGLVLFSATLSALGYGIYAIESETARAHPGILVTTPVVLFGILRYLQIVFVTGEAEEPESVLFRDPWMLGTLGLFVLLSAAAMLGNAWLPWEMRP